VRADASNAGRVYLALAAFGAPLHSFEVSEADFVTYDGVLQIGLPPHRMTSSIAPTASALMKRLQKALASSSRAVAFP
jgi:hypothetical protein